MNCFNPSYSGITASTEALGIARHWHVSILLILDYSGNAQILAAPAGYHHVSILLILELTAATPHPPWRAG
ncbi:MAG: hypothetical protein IPK76_22435 [Lewinellaceae bacterium]|nr:hypothetical protein [Lewinellaceae bacterium]